jgi:S-adenosylmethionine hydrolase
MPRSVITLTTDFGPSSPYVAQMKGVILAIHGEVELIDVTHAIPPQQILAGAVTLLDVYHCFPPGTIHIAVVDPGVGSNRAIALAEIDCHFFVAPDNGLLGLVAGRTTPTRIVHLEASEFWRQPISPTFHGRDIMAPVAAHLARGVDFERFGVSQKVVCQLSSLDAVVTTDSAQGTVLAVDSFGNLTTNLDRDMLPRSVSELTLRIDSQAEVIVPFVATYADRPADQLVALVGSSRRIEIAVVNGNAGEQLGADTGTQIRFQW